MKRLFSLTAAIMIATSFMSSCKKEEGEGGNSSIVGNVIMREYYDATFFQMKSEHPAYGENVYIIYGDNTGVGDNTDVGPDGSYEFKYLRKGKYKVFVISEDSVHATLDYVPDTVLVKEVEIKEKKETVDAGTFIIYKVLN